MYLGIPEGGGGGGGGVKMVHILETLGIKLIVCGVHI